MEEKVTCRVCLKRINGNEEFHSTNNIIHSKLNFPLEIDLGISENTIVCHKCKIEETKFVIKKENVTKNEDLPSGNVSENQNLPPPNKDQQDGFTEKIKEELNVDTIKTEEVIISDCELFDGNIGDSMSVSIFYYCYHCNYCTDNKKNLTDHVFNHRVKCKWCTYTIPDDFSLVSHEEIHCKVAPLQCNISNCSSLDKHVCTDDKKLPFNSENLYECFDCGYQTGSKITLELHVMNHKRITSFYCNLCHFGARSKAGLRSHGSICSGEKQHKKIKAFKRGKNGLSNKIVHIDKLKHKCEFCNFASSRKSRLKIHVRKHILENKSKQKLFKCDECDYNTCYNSKLIVHKRMHTGEKPFKCHLCDYCCTRSDRLKLHMYNHCVEKPFKCEQCDYNCRDKYKLTIHKRVHTGEKPYKCNFCDYCSIRSDHLKSHMYKHSGEWPYKCEECDFNTSNKTQFMNHKSKVHSGEKFFKCTFCNYQCNELRTLHIHLRSKHADKKNFNCDKCDYATYCDYKLLRHRQLHTGEKLYKCNECDYGSNKSGNFKLHLRKHTGEKPFKCKLCDYCSRNSSLLKTHMYKHSNEWPFKCDQCDYKTDRKFWFAKHKSVHTRNALKL